MLANHSLVLVKQKCFKFLEFSPFFELQVESVLISMGMPASFAPVKRLLSIAEKMMQNEKQHFSKIMFIKCDNNFIHNSRNVLKIMLEAYNIICRKYM